MTPTTRKHTQAVPVTDLTVCVNILLRWLSFVLFFFSSISVHSQSIFSNTIVGVNPAQFNPFTEGQLVDPQLIANGIGRGQGITANIGNNLYNAANFNASPRDTSDYFSFTLTPATGYQINLVSFSYTGQRSANGPLNFALRSSLNNFTTDIGTGNAVASTISLSAVTFQNITSAVEFRLYGWNATNASGTFGITSFSFNGEVLVAPRLQASAINGFGSICVGNSSPVQTIQLSGLNITNDSVKAGPLRGFVFSANGIDYRDSIYIFMPGNQTRAISVKFVPDTIRNFNGNIIITGGGASPINVPVSGAGIGTRPSITNGNIISVTTSSATISFNVVMAGCSIITGIGIEYSTVPGFANGTGTMVPLATFTQSASAYSMMLTSLGPPGQIYYFHTYITNNGGVKYGAENSFTLLSDVTTLTVPTSGAGSLSTFGNVCVNTISPALFFTLTGSVLDNSNIIIGPLNGFSFSTTATGIYTSTLTIVSGGLGYSYINGSLTNCRVYVKFNPLVTADYSGVIMVTGGGVASVNLPVTAFGVNSSPDVVTGNAIQITPYSAYLQGNIRNNGCTPVSSYGFEYSTISGFVPGTGTTVNATNLNNGSFGASITGLQPSTVYYYYAFAINAGGIDYGSLNTFYTSAIPTQLLISSIIPTAPMVFTPFSVQVTAVDNLTDRNPINVTSDTYLQLTQMAGINLFTAGDSLAAMIPAGSSSVVLNGNFYDAPELSVAIKAVAMSGMNLQSSPSFYFDVIPFVASDSFIWNAPNGKAWLIGNNWVSGTSPGSTFMNLQNRHVAYFTSQASFDSGSNAGAGIDLSRVNGDMSLGAIVLDSSYSGATSDGYHKIGNLSTIANGILQLNGKSMEGQPVLDGHTSVNVMLSNRTKAAAAKKLAIVNSVNEGNKEMKLKFSEEGYMVADTGNEIHLNVQLLGSSAMHLSGGGLFSLKPSGGSNQNNFTGDFMVEHGLLKIANAGAFCDANPNKLVLGDGFSHAGKIDLNGFSLKTGGLKSTISDNRNEVFSDPGDAIFTIQNIAADTFHGVILDGAAGMVGLVKTGPGIQVLTGNNTYTGITEILQGTLVLANVNGQTIEAGSDVILDGGTLRIASDQILHDLSLLGGRMIIDSGVVLTINGNYLQSGSVHIENHGKIIMQGTARQFFPGSGATVDHMNDLTIDNALGVTLNHSLRIEGMLQLVRGNFNWGADTLSIAHPVSGNTQLFLPSVNSWIEIFGTDTNTNLPSTVHQLAGFIVTSSAGTHLNGHLNVSQKMIVADTAGTIMVPYDVTLNGAAMLVMEGGKLVFAKNGVVLPEFTGAYQLNGGEIVFDGLGINNDAQQVRAINYHNLSFSSNGGWRVLSSSGNTGVYGSFSPGSGGVVTIGSTIDFKSQGNQAIPSFQYFHLRLTGGNNSVKTLTGPVHVKASMTIGALTRLNLAAFDLTLLSDTMMTAQVAAIPTSNSIIYSGAGRFVVERFIPSGINHGKSWQFLSVPVSGATMKESWQEGSSPLMNSIPGYGITVSSNMPGAIQRGFDFYTPAGGPSVKTYDSNSNNWMGIDDGTLETNQINLSNSKGYMIFVRGDRSVLQYNSPATSTVIRCRGKLYAKGTDAPASVIMNPGQFTSLANPYASGLDFLNLLSSSPGMDPVYYVWDPLLPGAYGLGGYQTISAMNGYQPVPGGTGNYNTGNAYTKIASGQAFLVHSGSGGFVYYNENQKTNSQQLPFRISQSNNVAKLGIHLFNASGQLIDGALLFWGDRFSGDISENDVPKFMHQTTDLCINKAGSEFSIASFNFPQHTDTIFLDAFFSRSGQFSFQLDPINFSRLPYTIYLHDDSTGINHSVGSFDSSYFFSIAENEKNKELNRFYLVVVKKRQLPSNLITSLSNKNEKSPITQPLSYKISLLKNESDSDNGRPIITQFYDMAGRLVYEINQKNSGKNIYNSLKINLNLPRGIYFKQTIYLKSGKPVIGERQRFVM